VIAAFRGDGYTRFEKVQEECKNAGKGIRKIEG
jgi:hypothetical protein